MKFAQGAVLAAGACVLLFATPCSRIATHTLSYTIEVSDSLPRQMTIAATLTGWSGPHLDLRAHSPSEVMLVEQLEATTGAGRRLRWIEHAETTRVKGTSLRVSTFRIQGPIPSTVHVRYRVTPGRPEGDEHIGFSGRCFGYLGPEFAVVTGRDVFLVPDNPESIPSIDVNFSLPAGWTEVTPWRQAPRGWVVDAPRGGAAEHLVASTVGLGRFRERTFSVGRTRVRLAFPMPLEELTVDRTQRALEKAAKYLHTVFGRDLGPGYVVIAAPASPNGNDIAGGGWASGQGGTLVPLGVERLREFAEEYIQAYVRYPPYRTEIRRPEEFWLVDGITYLYSRRAVSAAGFGDEEGVRRVLAAGYLTAVTTEGVERNLERLYAGGPADKIARESLSPYMLQHLDHELKTKCALARGMDSVLPKLFRDRFAPSLWSLLPNSSGCEWNSFRTRYIQQGRIAPVPELFTLAPTRADPIPPGGPPVSSLTLVYTGNTDGYLENCGCKANESGGIARRATVLDSIRNEDREALLLDAGSAFNRPEPFESPNALAKYEQRFYLEMMDRMGYDAAAIGMGEIARGQEYFREQTRGLRTPFITANMFAEGAALGPRSVLLRSHGRRIAVIGVFEPPRGGRSMLRLDRELSRLQDVDPIEAIPAEAALARSRADMVLVMGKLAPSTIRRLVQACRDLDVIISTDISMPQWGRASGGEAHKLILEDDRPGFIGRTLVLYTQMGQYGLSAARLSLDRAGQIVRARVTDSWLTGAVRDQEGIRRELNRFYDRVGALPEAQSSVHPPLADDPYWQAKPYAGSEACQGCHEAEYTQWKTTPHASAYKTLLDRHRHYQPVCISCHVVGFGSKFGYSIGQAEHPFGNVQCEVCHGPGAAHAAAPGRSNIRKEVPEHVCAACHTPEHSHNFVYAQRLPMVSHRALERVSVR